MYRFKDLTPTNGFDFENLDNARQNNYAWSMSELGDYIYVGTGRNIPLRVIESIPPGLNPPSLLKPMHRDDLGEIWRYKKDGSLPWKRVYKATDPAITGFRFMISYRPAGGSPALFAASAGSQVKVMKSTNGVDWFEMNLGTLEGTSSRSMVVINNRLYIATIDDLNLNQKPLLYRSKDPEYYPWEDVIGANNPIFDPNKNPQGSINSMAIFNDRLYVATSNLDGAQVWRTEGEEPQINNWVLVVDKGFGDAANKYVLSMGVFKDHLYVSGTKSLPLSWVIPFGFDMIRINKNDKWELVIGGEPLIPSIPLNRANGVRGESISGFDSGFNNPFNVYAWQIQAYKGRLLVSTFDDSSNMEVILDTLLANRAAIESIIGTSNTEMIIRAYESIVRILARIRYPIGFDLYVSENGRKFEPVIKRGLNNPNNYGGRMLFVDSQNELYLGTANPFEGCEMWKVKYEKDDKSSPSNTSDERNCNQEIESLDAIEELKKNFTILQEKLTVIEKILI